jgi:DNA-directed RNA polymerase specialized sigma24 family protein
MRKRLSATLSKAEHALYLVRVRGYTQSQTAVLLELNVGTVCHIVHGRRFRHARPVQYQEY